MQKLQALVDHLTAAVIAKPEQIRGVMESGEPMAVFDESGPDLLIFTHRYTGRVVLEDYPHDLGHLLACVCAWFEENGEDRDELLDWSGEPTDDKLADVEIRMRFEEAARYVVKPEGYPGRDVVTWKAVEWVPGGNVANVATDFATEGETA